MITRMQRYAPIAYSLVASAVFLDSLRFKYTNAIETQVIFGRLDAWATSLGAPGLFAQTGLFSQYVIGTAELLAATLLLLGLFPVFRRLQTLRCARLGKVRVICLGMQPSNLVFGLPRRLFVNDFLIIFSETEKSGRELSKPPSG